MSKYINILSKYINIHTHLHTHTHNKQELIVQGAANFLTGMFGGLGGSALIGETVINVLHGARGRLSCVVTGLTMLVIMESLGPVVKVKGGRQTKMGHP